MRFLLNCMCFSSIFICFLCNPKPVHSRHYDTEQTSIWESKGALEKLSVKKWLQPTIWGHCSTIVTAVGTSWQNSVYCLAYKNLCMYDQLYCFCLNSLSLEKVLKKNCYLSIELWHEVLNYFFMQVKNDLQAGSTSNKNMLQAETAVLLLLIDFSIYALYLFWI